MGVEDGIIPHDTLVIDDDVHHLFREHLNQLVILLTD